MIEAKLFRDEGVVEIFPEGSLTPADFEQIAALIDPYIEQQGRLKGVMVVAYRFPGWESFAALAQHIRFVREHEKQVARVATVSDGATLAILPELARHFVQAEVRHFPFEERDAAFEWLKQAAY
jgi:hypothetical protein